MSQRNVKFYAVVAGVTLVWASLSSAQQISEDAIFKVQVDRAEATESSIQTGFLVSVPSDTGQGSKAGILTALHGILDAERIGAFNSNSVTLAGLDLECLNLESDLAFLLPKLGEEQKSLGEVEPIILPAHTTVNPGRAYVKGYPYGTSLTKTDFDIRTPPLRMLRQIITDDVFALLDKRGSPHVDQCVIHIQGVLVPGLSGAPIVAENAVVGVANGGLDGGGTEYVWATLIPSLPCDSEGGWKTKAQISSADWSKLSKFKVTEAMSGTARLPPSLPFRMSHADESMILGPMHSAKSTIEILEDGAVIIKTDMENRDDANGLCIRPTLVVRDVAGDKIDSVVADRICVSSGYEVKLCDFLRCEQKPVTKREGVEYKGALKPSSLTQIFKVSFVHEPVGKNLLEEVENKFLELLN